VSAILFVMHLLPVLLLLACADKTEPTGDLGDTATVTEAETDADTDTDADSDTDTDTDADTDVDTDTAADTSPPEDTSPPGDTAPPEDTAPPLSDYDLCFEDLGEGGGVGPEYDLFSPTIGSHCSGTNHQDIVDIDRVVFLGDSVTVGTPPTSPGDFYRSILADQIADAFTLRPPSGSWEWYNVFDGHTLVQDSGDFCASAEWGARTDDLMRDDSQVLDCFPEDERGKDTLVIMTIGGNDLNSLTQGFQEGKSHEELWEEVYAYMELMRQAVEWMVDPANLSGEVYVIFTNLYEYTDGTGDVESCWAAEIAGYESITDPALEEMVLWSMEEFMSIAVDTETDMLFLLEEFCGHGFNYADPDGRCYRGADAELWFDLTCIHPNPTGHQAIADMFYDVVME